jgi:hypothetical protein
MIDILRRMEEQHRTIISEFADIRAKRGNPALA